jgi:hypothetical protein
MKQWGQYEVELYATLKKATLKKRGKPSSSLGYDRDLSQNGR